MAVPNIHQRLISRNSQLFSQNFESSKQTSSDFSVSLRKKKRLQNSIQKRLNFNSNPQESPYFQLKSHLESLKSHQLNSSSISKLFSIFSSQDLLLLTQEDITFLLSLLQIEGCQIQVTNILITLTFYFPEFNEDLVRSGVFSSLSPFLSKHRTELCRNAIWVLTNLMIETKSLKSRFVTFGLLDCLIELIQLETLPAVTMGTVMWALDSFSEQILKLSEGKMKTLLRVLKERMNFDEEKDAIFGILGNVFRGREDFIELVINQGNCRIFVEGLKQEKGYLSLRLVSFVLASEDSRFTEMLVEAGVLAELFSCLSSQIQSIKTDALLCFSNLAAEKYEIAKQLLNQTLIEKMMEFLNNDENSIHINAAFFFRNLSVKIRPSDVKTLEKFGVFRFICLNLEEVKEKAGFKEILNFLHFSFQRADRETLEVLKDSGVEIALKEILVDFRFADAVLVVLEHFRIQGISEEQPMKFDI